MMPWGHLAVGYLVYTVATRMRHRRAPRELPVLALAVGTQLPDLVDKPLNWWFGVFDGRAIGHSLFVAVFVCAVAFAVARRFGGVSVVSAFAVGVFTHLLGDAVGPLYSGDYHLAAFVLWPLFPAPTYPKDSPLDHLQQWAVEMQSIAQSPSTLVGSQFGLQLLLFAVLASVWAADGFPGIRAVWKQFVDR
jgi:hypothetical protein